MTIAKLIDDIGDDADLLVRSDEWLEHERRRTAEQIDELVQTLSAIMKAQQIKTILQDRNMIPLQQIERDKNGNPTNIYIMITDLPTALSLIRAKPADEYDELNNATQLNVWERDNYDIAAFSG